MYPKLYFEAACFGENNILNSHEIALNVTIFARTFIK
jgi:hypothetical protein